MTFFSCTKLQASTEYAFIFKLTVNLTWIDYVILSFTYSYYTFAKSVTKGGKEK
jgi:hypothetical protein